MKSSSRILVFTFFEFFNKGIPFLLLPVLTRYLTPDNYGIIATFLVFMSFFAIFIGLSGHGAVDANYFRMSKKRLARYISNVIFILLISFGLLSLLVLIFNEQIFTRFGLPFEWQLVALVVALSQFITLINLTLWVIEKNPIYYGFYQTSQTILFASLSLFMVVLLKLGWIGHLTALSISATFFGLVSVIFLYKRGFLTFKLRKLYIKDFLMFGVPMVPHQLGDWFRTQGDKLIIVTFIGAAATGLFSVGQQIALVMLILISSLNRALYPVLYHFLSDQPSLSDKKMIVNKSYQIALAMTIVGVIGVFLTPVVYPYLLGEKFQSSLQVTQLIIIAMTFEAYYYLVVNYVFYSKKTKILAKITFTIAILHLTLSFIFIGILELDYHYIAYSIIASSFLQFVLVWLYANKIYPMPWLSFYKKES